MAAEKPYRVEGGPRPAGIIRREDGRFDLEEPSQAVPPNPLAEEAEGKQPDEWAPGVGQCTDPLVGQKNPWPEAKPPTERKPMKLGG